MSSLASYLACFDMNIFPFPLKSDFDDFTDGVSGIIACELGLLECRSDRVSLNHFVRRGAVDLE